MSNNRRQTAEEFKKNFMGGRSDEVMKDLLENPESLQGSALLNQSGVALATIGSAVDAFTGDVSYLNNPVEAAQEGMLNVFQGTGNAALGAGIGAGLGYATRQHKPKDTEGMKADLKKKAQEIMRKDGETAGKQYFADNKDNIKSGGLRTGQMADNYRRTVRGAAIGAAATLVPTLLGMRDQQTLANQSASLM